MIQGLYSAASSLTAAVARQEVISDNLAHATVSGYRSRGVGFSTFDQGPDGNPVDGAGQPRGTQASREYTLFTPGDYQQTDNPLEFAIRGDGFFVVQGPSGSLYTRNGSFELNSEGQLQTKGGLPVTGDGGPISIPVDARKVTVGQDGRVAADGVQVGRLQVVSFSDPSKLIRIGATYFEKPANAEPQEGRGEVLQGYREGANVNVIQEMVNLIAGARHYEAASKALSTISDTLRQRTQAQSQQG